MKTKLQVELNENQINHLLNLLFLEQGAGTYYGNREQYETRAHLIYKELMNALPKHQEKGSKNGK